MPKHAHVSWDDLIYVLAVADHGSVSAAARALSVNHATVLRRISAFESRQGFRVFDRTPRGYQVSADRRALIEVMRNAGDALGEVDRMIDAERPRLSSGLRITSTDTLMYYVLPPVLAELASSTGIQIELRTDNAHLDFGRMEADITVRPTMKLGNDMSGERAGQVWFGLYAASGAADSWLGLSGPLSRSVAGTWVRERAGLPSVNADSFLTLAAFAAEGRGRVILPTYVGENTAGLVRLDIPEDLEPVPIWVASHVDFAKSGRLLRARRHIAKMLAEAPTLLKPQAD